MQDSHVVKDHPTAHSDVKSAGGRKSGAKPSAAVTWAVNIMGPLLIAAAIAAFYFLPRFLEKPGEGAAPAGEAPAKKDPSLVKIDENQKSSIGVNPAALHVFQHERECTGRIVYNDEKTTPVYAEFTGRIKEIYKKPGDSVAKDDVLYEIDTPDLVQAETDLISAESSLKKSNTALKLATAGKAIATSNLGIAKTNLEIADAAIAISKITEHLAELNQKRQAALVLDKAVAEKDSEQAQRDFQSAKRDSQSALRDKETAKRDAAQAQKDLEQADSDIASATADIEAGGHIRTALRERLKATFGKTDSEIDTLLKEHVIDRIVKVKAPIEGAIASRKISHGQFIKPDNPDPLFTITDLSSMWLVADVYEADSPQIQKGSVVEVKALAFPEMPLHATVTYLSPSVNPDTRRVGVRCVIDVSQAKSDDERAFLKKVQSEFRSEMFATFTIPIGKPYSKTFVPPDAIVRDGLEDVIYVRKSDLEFERRKVLIGMTDVVKKKTKDAEEIEKYVEILGGPDGAKGLDVGENVVVKGAIFINSEGK